MKVALIDPFAGIAGDMLAGALIHAGAPFEAIRAALEGYRVSFKEVQRGGIASAKFVVEATEETTHRGLGDVLEILRGMKLSDRARERAAAAFTRLAEAEARVHGVDVNQVHFHEVGAVDSICDIVGAAVALDALQVDRLYCRALPLSRGSVETAHGRLPLPAPATLELTRGLPTRETDLEGELVTPTGAAMVAAWAERGAVPGMRPESIGYGAGDRDPEGFPNVCRVIVGEAQEGDGGLWELVCEVDDATPQVLGHLLSRLMESGALDASLQPLVMKKNRPGTRVAALARAESIPVLEQVLFTEGTTLGVRRRRVERTELPRRTVEVRTRHGNVRVKLGELGGKLVHVAPEYEDCRALAAKTGVPLREIIEEAVAQWRA
ncbi:MAG: nickel pincer cofactor biosynthesis protein LarC [Planctomycetota bacterium]|jgi:uncharacterized protein (TIGR00299 family) protein